MKRKIFFIIPFFVFALFITSCSKDNDLDKYNYPQSNTQTISSDNFADYLSTQAEGTTINVKISDTNLDFEKIRNGLNLYNNVNVKLDLSKCVNLREIPENAFYNKKISKNYEDETTGINNLLSCILPQNVEKIGNNAFKDCNSLESINLPTSLNEIGSSAFSNCKSLTSIIIPEGVNKINQLCFYGCENLTSIVIPSTIVEIDYNAFFQCNQLTNITNNSHTDIPNTTESFLGSYQSSKIIYSKAITRTDNNTSTYCNFHNNYFQFDFNDGALFQISLTGEILFTTELVPITEYANTYGVCIKNFETTETTISFDLADGEYSTNFAHYVIDLTKEGEYYFNTDIDNGTYQQGTLVKTVEITRTDNNAISDCGIFENYFEFDFIDGAQFQISFVGEILHTSELSPLTEFKETNGVSIKNFEATQTTITFDLADGEYSTSYAHYIIDLTKVRDYDYNFGIFDNGTYQSGAFIKAVEITRTDNNAISCCIIYDNFFQFDFDDGAQFQISFDGQILYTSEGLPMGEYSETYGFCIKNFEATETTITFDLADGEYSTNFAHYVIDLTKESDTITRTDNNAVSYCNIFETYFEFDFDDGAHFQISFDGEILHTSECSPIEEYKETYGVCIKNFTKTDYSISFDLIDGEYSSNFAHYEIKL